MPNSTSSENEQMCFKNVLNIEEISAPVAMWWGGGEERSEAWEEGSVYSSELDKFSFIHSFQTESEFQRARTHFSTQSVVQVLRFHVN